MKKLLAICLLLALLTGLPASCGTESTGTWEIEPGPTSESVQVSDREPTETIRAFDDVTAGGNLVFRVDGRKVEEDAAIREAWQRYRDGGESGVKMQCLVTGKEDEIAAVHPSVKGVRDAQSSGAALVSFNAPAFCSYGREQNYNAPVGKYAAFAYTAALNHLLADSDHIQHIGDTTVVCWAEGADDAYPGFFSAVIGGGTYLPLAGRGKRCGEPRRGSGRPLSAAHAAKHRLIFLRGRVARPDGRMRAAGDWTCVLLAAREISRPCSRSGAGERLAAADAVPRGGRPVAELSRRRNDDLRQGLQRKMERGAHAPRPRHAH